MGRQTPHCLGPPDVGELTIFSLGSVSERRQGWHTPRCLGPLLIGSGHPGSRRGYTPPVFCPMWGLEGFAESLQPLLFGSGRLRGRGIHYYYFPLLSSHFWDGALVTVDRRQTPAPLDLCCLAEKYSLCFLPLLGFFAELLWPLLFGWEILQRFCLCCLAGNFRRVASASVVRRRAAC
jgi:hypothetical protein